MEAVDSPCHLKSSIKRIDRTTVHNICSGQVIVSLSSAVKELVENSLDAGATSVEVHLRDHGTTSIEVVDNGAGIHEDDFEAIGLKHHTSKLREFADLPGVATFGFRGEALGSLCALADVAMVTRHRSSAVGCRLRFSSDGRLAERTPAPRQVGTTVTVRQLFAPLPVRRRQFCARARRELTDLLHLLWGYALVTTGVRLTCSQQAADGRKNVLLASPGGASLGDRVAALFGQKQLAALAPLVSTAPSEATLLEFGLSAAQRHADVTVEGLISSCEHGKGRSAPDRQFIFVNGRPCDHSKIHRLVNEIYRSYNRHQSPFLVLSLSLTRQKVDVNVTPDKRMLFVQNEKYLLAAIKETLLQCFEGLPSSYAVTSLTPSQSPGAPSVTCGSSSPALSADWISTIKRNVKKIETPSKPSKRQCLDRFFKRLQASPPEGAATDSSPPEPGDSSAAVDPGGRPSNCFPPVDARAAGDAADARLARPASPSECCVVEDEDRRMPAERDEAAAAAPPPTVAASAAAGDGLDTSRRAAKRSEPECVELVEVVPVAARTGLETADETVRSGAVGTAGCDGDAGPGGPDLVRAGDAGPGGPDLVCAGDAGPGGPDLVCAGDAGPGGAVAVLRSGCSGRVRTGPAVSAGLPACGDAGPGPQSCSPSGETSPHAAGEAAVAAAASRHPPGRVRKRTRLVFSMDELRRQLAGLEESRSPAECGGRDWRFRATIRPSDNSAAEEELKLQIKKDDFLKMDVVGQFNLGFLVARLDQDLFLIDQHASDEKFNFERLSRQPPAKQPLVVPQELELPAVSEETLLSRPELFAEAGFQVAADMAAAPGRRLRLLAAPAVLGAVCGRSDLEELIWLMQESPGSLTGLRPSRVRSMLASRACRTAVMIGTALSPAGMARLVRNMAEMEHPWNCPHGRPTMRHLVCLNMLKS